MVTNSPIFGATKVWIRTDLNLDPEHWPKGISKFVFKTKIFSVRKCVFFRRVNEALGKTGRFREVHDF
jgi:hypothetical protein